MHYWRYQFAIAAFLLSGNGIFLPALAEETTNAIEPFLIRSWQTDQGLPNNTVNAITQTRDGYLWLGTDGGLVRFDGVHCHIFGLKDGLGVLHISALLQDNSGALWIGTDGGGLSRLVNGTIKTYTVKNGLAGDSINALVEGSNGEIWIGTPTGLCCRRNGRFEPVAKELSSAFIFDLAKDRQGDIWIATLHDGLLRFHNGICSKVNGPTGMGDIAPRCLLVDEHDNMWVGSRAGVILRYKNGNWTTYDTNNGFPKVVTYHLAQTFNGLIWAGSWNEGLYYLQHGKFHVLQGQNGLSDNAILSLFVSQDGFLWAGTQSGGLDQIGPKKVSVYHVMENSSECQVRSLAQTTDGAIYVGAYGQGIYRWAGERFEQIPHGPVAVGHLTVEVLLSGHDGSLWWGAGPALYQWKSGKLISKYLDTPWLTGDRVWCLCEDRNGDMWVGTYNGKLGLLKRGNFIPAQGLSGRPITALAQSPDGTLWIGSLGGGLARMKDKKLAIFSTGSGLLSNSIRTLLLDSYGTLWIGTDGGGLARWSNGRIVNFTTRDGLIDDTILQILDDGDGNLWLGSNRGICCVNKQALDDVAAAKTDAVHPTVFQRADGMSSESCVGNFGAALKTDTDELCFSTSKGIVVINPKRQANHVAPPKILLEEILVDGKPLTNVFSQAANISGNEAVANRIEISPGRHSFEFYYTAFDYGTPKRIRFKYQLRGLDLDWTESEARVARYSYIPPGRYYFRVTAHSGNGEWNETGAGISFVVLPHFYQTLWFETLSALMILCCIGYGVRYFERQRHRARLKRLEQEQMMENERSRIARDLHDELGSSLTYISMSMSDIGRSQENNAEQLKMRVGKISNFTARTARSLDEIVWAVNPCNDSVRSLVEYLTQFARESFEDTNIHCRFQIPDDLPELALPPEARHNIFLVVKEALNNSLKHAEATEVFLCAKVAGQEVEILVQDNGIGFDVGLAQDISERNGLKNMRQRMEDLMGRLDVEAKPGSGTTVKLTISRAIIRNLKIKAKV